MCPSFLGLPDISNANDCLKIAIPYSAILDVEKSSAMDFSETIEVKVYDKNEGELFAMDSYFFAYFHDLSAALDQIRDAVRTYRTLPERGSPQMVLDTTVPRAPPAPISHTQSMPADANVLRTSSGFRLTSLLQGISLSRPVSNTTIPESASENEDFTHISRRPNSSFIPVTTSPKPMDGFPSSPELSDSLRHHMQQEQHERTSSKSLTPTPGTYDHTYPPSTSSSYYDPNHPSLSRESSGSSWSVGMPSWLKGSRRVFGSGTAADSTVSAPTAGVREMYSSTLSPAPHSRSSGLADMAFSVLETPEIPVDEEAIEKFRTAFAYDEKETLLGCASFSASLYNASSLVLVRFPWLDL